MMPARDLEQAAAAMFVPSRWAKLKACNSLVMVFMETIIGGCSELVSADAERDCDWFEYSVTDSGQELLYDPTTLDMTTESGYQRLVEWALRVQKNGLAWFHLPSTSWMPWESSTYQRGKCVVGNLFDSTVVHENCVLKRSCTLAFLMWLRGVHVFCAMQTPSRAKQYPPCKDLLKAALPFKLKLSWDIDASVEEDMRRQAGTTLDVYGSEVGIEHFVGDTQVDGMIPHYSSPDAFMEDLVKFGYALRKGERKASDIRTWASRGSASTSRCSGVADTDRST